MSSNGIHTRHQPPGGFTLVEILVVLIILSIATAVILPRVSNMGDLQVASAARTAMSDLQFAQNEAIVSQRSVTAMFNPDQGQYELRYGDGQLVTHPINKTPFRVRLADNPGTDDVTILAASFGGETSVTFDALGSPNSQGTVTFVAGGFRQRLDVAPVTGRITATAINP
ncbi:MAG: type II secretion system protein [Planctomycetes bacterium]|nr:type II secretion system protein [Planctomycetota bacterium]